MCSPLSSSVTGISPSSPDHQKGRVGSGLGPEEGAQEVTSSPSLSRCLTNSQRHLINHSIIQQTFTEDKGSLVQGLGLPLTSLSKNGKDLTNKRRLGRRPRDGRTFQGPRVPPTSQSSTLWTRPFKPSRESQ